MLLCTIRDLAVQVGSESRRILTGVAFKPSFGVAGELSIHAIFAFLPSRCADAHKTKDRFACARRHTQQMRTRNHVDLTCAPRPFKMRTHTDQRPSTRRVPPAPATHARDAQPPSRPGRAARLPTIRRSRRRGARWQGTTSRDAWARSTARAHAAGTAALLRRSCGFLACGATGTVAPAVPRRSQAATIPAGRYTRD